MLIVFPTGLGAKYLVGNCEKYTYHLNESISDRWRLLVFLSNRRNQSLEDNKGFSVGYITLLEGSSAVLPLRNESEHIS